jgi:hypothetical protein
VGESEEPWEGQIAENDASCPRPFPPLCMIEARYTTTNPHLASFLVSEGANLLSLQRTGPKRVQFAFAACRELHVLLRLYWGGHPIPIVPCKLLDTLHDLKCRSITRH